MKQHSRAGFLRALRETPADRATRLIYSDWLEEHGDGPSDAAQMWLLRYGEAEHGAVFVLTRDSLVMQPCYALCLRWWLLPAAPGEATSYVDTLRTLLLGSDQMLVGFPPGFDEGMQLTCRYGLLSSVTASENLLFKHLPTLVKRHPIVGAYREGECHDGCEVPEEFVQRSNGRLRWVLETAGVEAEDL